jgi:hypothetical protein
LIKKCFLLVAVLLCVALPAHGQSTTVSGTITDSGGQAWFAGTIQFVFRVSPSNPSAQYMWNGAPFSSSSTFPQNPLSLDGTGSFSGLSIPSNTAIAPAGSQWAVTVCPAATVPNCFTKLLTITGATQSISSQVVPPPVVVNLSVPLLGARAYADAEIVGGTPGIQYLNVTDNTIHVCVQAGFPPCTWVSQATGGTNQPTFNGVLFVGGSNSSFWGGGDIGSQINNAYAALPPPGGEIVVIPKSDGTCYAFTTPVIATVANKYLLLDGWGSDSQNGVISNGACLNYTPTTATTAIKLDYVPAIGGGVARNHGVRNLTLINNQGNTTGGTGSSAVGIECATVNAGCQNAAFENLRVNGFGTGIKLDTPASSPQASFGTNCTSCSLGFNTTGFSIATGIENTSMVNPIILGNATGISMGSSSAINLTHPSCDANTVLCVKSTGGTISITNPWFENQGGAQMEQVDAGLSLTISGGQAIDDCVSSGACGGVTPAFWFRAPFLTVNGLSIDSAGRVPSLVFSPTLSGTVVTTNITPAVLTHSAVAPITGANTVLTINDGTHLAAVETPMFLADGGPQFVIGDFVPGAGWGTTATSSLSGLGGGINRFTFAITSSGTGQALNPTVTITFPNQFLVLPQAQCKQTGGTGAINLVFGENTAISTSGMSFIWNGTPAAGLSYQFTCFLM